MKFTIDVFDPSVSDFFWIPTPVGGSPMLFRYMSEAPCYLVNACVDSFCSMIKFSKFVGGITSAILLLLILVRLTLFNCFLLLLSHLSLHFVFVTLSMWYCLWEVSLVRNGVVLIAATMCHLLLCNLLTLGCLFVVYCYWENHVFWSL